MGNGMNLLAVTALYCTWCVMEDPAQLWTKYSTSLIPFDYCFLTINSQPVQSILICSLLLWNIHTVLLPLSPSVSAALWCNCTTAQCEKAGSQCETDGACMASTSFIDGQEQHIRICITRDNLVPPGQPFYCRGAEGLLNIHCCYTDYCNSIDLKVPSGENCHMADTAGANKLHKKETSLPQASYM